MKCTKCQADIPNTTQFCPNCSHPVVHEQDIKSSSEVSSEWLKTILEALKYKVEVNETDPNILFASHNEAPPNLFLQLFPDTKVIAIDSFFRTKKVDSSQKPNFLSALNKANTSNRVCAFCTTDSMDRVQASTFIYITEYISSRDVCAILRLFFNEICRSPDVSGLREFV